MITNSYSYTPNFQGATRQQMQVWRCINNIPKYVNAAYDGYTGAKICSFPLSLNFERSFYPDITEGFHKFETKILQELKDCRKENFGYIKALMKMCKNLGTGEAWDTKFLPKFPGRNKKGEKQYALYNNEIVSANELSNLFYGHVCKYMGFPVKVALLIAKLDAAGMLEPFSKGKFPSIKLLKFRDPASDQRAIVKGMMEFDINKYHLE